MLAGVAFISTPRRKWVEDVAVKSQMGRLQPQGWRRLWDMLILLLESFSHPLPKQLRRTQPWADALMELPGVTQGSWFGCWPDTPYVVCHFCQPLSFHPYLRWLTALWYFRLTTVGGSTEKKKKNHTRNILLWGDSATQTKPKLTDRRLCWKPTIWSQTGQCLAEALNVLQSD